MSQPEFQLQIAGENALMLYFSQRIDPDISALVQHSCQQIRAHCAEVLLDILPSYASILLIFNPFKTNHHELSAQLQQVLRHSGETGQRQGRRVELPVYYSEHSGPDLAKIAEAKQLTVDEVIQRHHQLSYRVYAIGFAPGFAYLGELDPLLQTPRLTSPRAKVPKGAVAIADRQTAVYPAASPGGWNLIGLCPVAMFNPAQSPVMPVAVGDEVQFVPISKAEFLRLGGEL